MREFVYFSSKASTTGNFDDLMKAGRMDIAIHFLINALFLSHDIRRDTRVHFIFYGQPNPPRHLEFEYKEGIPLSKKDVAGLIKRMLYKYREGQKTEVFPGCFIEKKSFSDVLEEISREKEVYVLEEGGEDVAGIKLEENAAYVIGDQEGFPQKELKRLKKKYTTISLGRNVYFASHVVTILNYLLDRKD
jgi:tRNA (pseudouridine54-N1)-methyltransferase